MGDRDAVKQCGLDKFIQALPGLFTAIGDCAYMPTEHMAPIFQGTQRDVAKNDAFNFFASQLRIRIEMAFGLMVKKWGILNRQLGCNLRRVKYLIVAIAQLHNFCINERLAENSNVSFQAREVELGINERAMREEAAVLEAAYAEFSGQSLNRDRMATKN